ncbi:MAG: hypothetical protein HYV09_40555 [Deltaproteobacteria bacterium]|nr:hypothetical protein [Deltaproteobacteria bacterium]
MSGRYGIFPRRAWRTWMRRIPSEARLVALYLFTAGEGGVFPAFVLRHAAIVEDTGLSVDHVDAALAAIEDAGVAVYDREESIAYVVAAVRELDIAGPKQAKGARRQYDELPDCPTTRRAFVDVEAHLSDAPRTRTKDGTVTTVPGTDRTDFATPPPPWRTGSDTPPKGYRYGIDRVSDTVSDTPSHTLSATPLAASEARHEQAIGYRYCIDTQEPELEQELEQEQERESESALTYAHPRDAHAPTHAPAREAPVETDRAEPSEGDQGDGEVSGVSARTRDPEPPSDPTRVTEAKPATAVVPDMQDAAVAPQGDSQAGDRGVADASEGPSRPTRPARSERVALLRRVLAEHSDVFGDDDAEIDPVLHRIDGKLEQLAFDGLLWADLEAEAGEWIAHVRRSRAEALDAGKHWSSLRCLEELWSKAQTRCKYRPKDARAERDRARQDRVEQAPVAATTPVSAGPADEREAIAAELSKLEQSHFRFPSTFAPTLAKKRVAVPVEERTDVAECIATAYRLWEQEKFAGGDGGFVVRVDACARREGLEQALDKLEPIRVLARDEAAEMARTAAEMRKHDAEEAARLAAVREEYERGHQGDETFDEWNRRRVREVVQRSMSHRPDFGTKPRGGEAESLGAVLAGSGLTNGRDAA